MTYCPTFRPDFRSRFAAKATSGLVRVTRLRGRGCSFWWLGLGCLLGRRERDTARERERERDRQTDRQKDRQTDRHTDIQTDRKALTCERPRIRGEEVGRTWREEVLLRRVWGRGAASDMPDAQLSCIWPVSGRLTFNRAVSHLSTGDTRGLGADGTTTPQRGGGANRLVPLP